MSPEYNLHLLNIYSLSPDSIASPILLPYVPLLTHNFHSLRTYSTKLKVSRLPHNASYVLSDQKTLMQYDFLFCRIYRQILPLGALITP